MRLKLKRISKKGFLDLDLEFKKFDAKTRLDILKLGSDTAKTMRDVIRKKKKRPQAGEPEELEKSINVDYFGDKGWGVGDISKLPAYWKAINWGSFHMVGKHLPVGAFAPGNPTPNKSSFRAGRFKENSSGVSPIVKKPILPMNFVEKTHFWLAEKLAKLNKLMMGRLK